MKEILTVCEVKMKYNTDNHCRNLMYTAILFDGVFINHIELLFWMNQQSNDRKLLVMSFPNVDFLHFNTCFSDDETKKEEISTLN